MNDHGWIFRWSAGLLVCAAITGCVQSPMPGPAANSGATMATMQNAGEALNQLAADMAAARNAHLDLLSPGWFEKAARAFADARKRSEKGQPAANVEEAIRIARAHLRKAEVVATVSRTTLADVLGAREKAGDAGATQYEKAYRQAEDDFMDLARAIERDNLPYVEKNRDAVVNGYRQLEVRAIKAKTLGTVHTRIAQAKAAGSRRMAPQTYEQAIQSLNTADAFIAANPHARTEIRTKAANALFQANRLMAVTDAAKRFKTMAPEETALLLETYLHSITAELDASDMRDQDLQTQLDNIVGLVAALKNDRGFLSEQNKTLQTEMETLREESQARIDALHMQLAILEGKSREDQMAKERISRQRMAAEQRLAAERKFNQLYAAVQDYFQSDEAEVYKQDNQVVIRLKAMQFPVGKSKIMPANYPLLGKAQKAIRTFEAPRVTVEGHTDATGSDEGNMRLSQKRADAVRDYLINNQTLPADRITAVGYGAKRPLASNKTAAGRAMNRRIDILIIHQEKPI
ncbi:OmpA family protein [Desulfosarcina ovata]|uniref:OmpA-like domain-containing protein n=1 Tax=Desulfosarcina ovata subsp. ovata TaxID=2752305 RepID=A0A5K8ADE1_9BACT|nr:OmpA family protein [Desulfosarcina ovata]BBO90591.1 hypothetical protein DSCOOX_37710 [Desulfosarcina ovata subsp. ovata]